MHLSNLTITDSAGRNVHGDNDIMCNTTATPGDGNHNQNKAKQERTDKCVAVLLDVATSPLSAEKIR